MTRPLRVLGWGGRWGEALDAHVLAPFARASGCAVERVPHVGLALPPPATDGSAIDLVWCNATGAAEALARGAVRPFSPAFRAGAAALPARARRRLDEGVVFAYAVAYVLCYQRSVLERPLSWRALLAPEARGRVALYPGAHGFFPIAQVMGGGRLADLPRDPTACFAFLRRLGPSLGARDYSVGMERRFQDGSLVAAFRALPNALAFAAAGLDVGWTVPDEGTTDTVDGFFIPAGVPGERAELAEALLAFALSPAVQTRWCAALGAAPVSPEAATPELHPARLLRVADEIIEAHGPAWARRFEAISLQPSAVSPNNEADEHRDAGRR